MPNRIVMVSDDADFFDYIKSKLNLRKSDLLYELCFDDLIKNLDNFLDSVLVINSENALEKTCELLAIIKKTPSIVIGYNEDEDFRVCCLNLGALCCISLISSDKEINAYMATALNILSERRNCKTYREMLVEKKLITPNNEVYLDYTNVLDKEIENIRKNSLDGVLAAIAPNEKTKFLFQPNQIETFILANIRKSDVLMNFAPNKYFLLLRDTNTVGAEKIWSKIKECFSEKIYAGFALVGTKTRGQIINEALSKLHEAINKDYSSSPLKEDFASTSVGNFKIFRKEFNKKLEQIITPVFYLIQQKYADKLFGINSDHKIGDGFAEFLVKTRYVEGNMKITAPGCSKINIEVVYNSMQSAETNLFNQRRITLEPAEFEQGLLEDLLEQFIIDFKKEVDNEYT